MPGKVVDKNQNIKTQAASTAVKTSQEKVKKADRKEAKNEKPKSREAKKKDLSPKWWVKDIILAIVNLVFLIALVIILGRLPPRAGEHKRLRSTYVLETEKSKIEVAEHEIESSKKMADELTTLFPDEAGLADFAKELDKLKSDGLVYNFTFASEHPVRDQTGSFGVPVVIKLSGSWAQIGEGLAKIEELPFMLRAVSIETEKITEENVIDFKYGGFLYVDESLIKD